MTTIPTRSRLSRSVVAIITSLLLAFSFPVLTYAANENVGDSGNDNIDGMLISGNDSANKTVKAGVFAFDGYHMKDDNGELYGYGIEVLEMISKYSHLNFDLIAYDSSWSDMLKMLEDGDIDVVTSASKTPEREAKFDYSLPIGKKSTVLSVSVNDEQFVPGNYSTYDGIVVGEISGNSQNVIFAEFANDKGFDYSVVEFENDTELTEALKDGEVDAILTSDLRKSENEKTLETIEDDNYYAIVRKGDTELLSEINYAIEQMNMNEGDWKNTLHYKYYGPNYSNQLQFTEREQQYIKEVQEGKKSIVATAVADRRPYSFSKDNALTGILIDYFAALMQIADLPFETVVPKDLAQYEDLVEQEKVNVLLDGISGGESSSKYFANGFESEVILDANVVQVTRTDFTGEIRSIAVTDYSTGSLDSFISEQTGKEIIHYPTRTESLEAVLNGQADCAYVYAYTAQEFINRETTNSLTYRDVYGQEYQFTIRINANTDHELLTIINKCIKQVPESTLNKLVTEYTSYNVNDLSFLEFLQANPAIVVVFLLILVAIVGFIVLLMLRERWNERLIASQEKSNKELQEQLSIVEALSRDYANVYSIDEKTKKAKVIKLEGYVTEGFKPSSQMDNDYQPILEKYVRDRVLPDDQEQLLEELNLANVQRQLSTNSEFTGTYRIHDDDEIHNFQYTYVPVEDKDGRFILAGFRNIDDTVRKEQEQREILAEALAQAQYANQAKTSFLNNMSHDIRTPMNAIIGFTALAGTHLDNTEQVKGYLSNIMTSSNHLLSLINDVLDMSRIESGKMKIDAHETSLPEVMHDLRTIVQADIKAKRLAFYIDMLGVTNEMVICDKLRLNQVLLNILSNAIKYTNAGGTVSVRIVQRDTDLQNGTAEYEFIIKDTGIGMSKKFLEHVFEPFEREETATVSGIQGTGLGLAITKNIVDMMGGEIEVKSEEGKGSEFIVSFRFKIAADSEQFTPPEELKDLRVLVVDDDMDTCTSVSSMLVSIGMRPEWTTLGEEAIAHTRFAQEQNDPYSAYIIDWIMPNMTGLEVVKRIRRIIGDETPIIVATSYDWTEIEDDAREAGVTAICSKPIFLSELRDILVRPFQEGYDKDSGEIIMPHQEGGFNSIQDSFDVAEDKLKGKKILMAEDNMMSREIAITILEDAGIEVDAVEDGSYAVERMKEMPAGTYDVVLTDVQMPIMNGYETTRAIRALEDPKKANIPIIAVTANAFEEDREEAEEAGVSGYIPKPIEIEKLFETLESLLED